MAAQRTLENFADRDADAPDAPPLKKRRRPALACRQCRRRKVRCDQKHPCNNCLKSKITDCTFPPPHDSVAGTSQTATSLSKRKKPLAPLIARVDAQQPGQSAHSTSTNLPTQNNALPISESLRTVPPSAALGGALNVGALLARIDGLDKTVVELRRGSGHGHSVHDVMNDDVAGPTTNDTSQLRFSNQSSWMNDTSLHSKVLRTLGKARGEKTDLHKSLAACKALGHQISKDVTAEDTQVKTVGALLPEKAVADQLINLYFCTFEDVFRVLHEPTFRAQYDEYWQQPPASPELFVLHMQMCMVLGAMAHEDSLKLRKMASQWMIEAQNWLIHSTKKAKKDRLFGELQLASLVCIAEANCFVGESISWSSMGSLLRDAMSLNLHRDPKHLGGKSLLQAEMHRRLWATILELNLLLSLQANQPPLMSTANYDTDWPANLDDEELSEEGSSAHQVTIDHDHHRLTATSGQLALHESFALRLNIVSKLTTLGGGLRYEDILQMHTDLSKAERKMQQRLASEAQLITSHGISKVTSSSRRLAEILLSRYFLALHLPVLGRAIKDPSYHFSRRVAVTVATKMADACGLIATRQHTTDESLELNDATSPLSQLFKNSVGLFRYLVVQAIFAITLEFVASKEEQRDDLATIPVWEEKGLLHHMESFQAWAESRVRAGLADVHTCCFIAGCKAYATALDAESSDPSVDDAIVDAALKSSERCHQALMEMKEKLGTLATDGVTATGNLNMDATIDWLGDPILDDIGTEFPFDWTYQAGPGHMDFGFMAL